MADDGAKTGGGARAGRDSGFHRATAALENPQFRRVFIGNMAFFLAMGGQGIIRPWIAYELTDSTFKLGLVAAAMAGPMFFLAPIGGVLADRFERRSLITAAQTFVLASEAIVLALLVTGRIEFWHLMAAAAALGCCFPIIMPARSAIVANLVGRANLGAAMGLNMTGVNVTRVVGPALAGVLMAAIGVPGAYAVNLVLYAFALGAMLTVDRMPPPPAAAQQPLLANLIGGFRYLAEDRFVAMLLVYGLVPQFLAMPFQNILPAFARDVWMMDELGVGILNAAVGAGAVTGSFYIAGRSQEKGRLDLMLASILAFGFVLVAFSQSPLFWPAVGLCFVANIGASIFSTLNNVAIQLVIPDEVRGRVSSFMMMSVSLPLLGALPVGALAERVGPPNAVAMAALAAALLAVLLLLASPLLRGLDERVRHELGRD